MQWSASARHSGPRPRRGLAQATRADGPHPWSLPQKLGQSSVTPGPSPHTRKRPCATLVPPVPTSFPRQPRFRHPLSQRSARLHVARCASMVLGVGASCSPHPVPMRELGVPPSPESRARLRATASPNEALGSLTGRQQGGAPCAHSPPPPAQGHRPPGTQPSAVLRTGEAPPLRSRRPPAPPSETWNEQSRPPSSSPASFPSCHEFSKCGRPRASCPVFDISSRGPCFRAPRRAQGYQELSHAVTVVVGLGMGALGRGSRAGETAPRQWGQRRLLGPALDSTWQALTLRAAGGTCSRDHLGGTHQALALSAPFKVKCGKAWSFRPHGESHLSLAGSPPGASVDTQLWRPGPPLPSDP